MLKGARNKIMLADAGKLGKTVKICTTKFDVTDRLLPDQKPANNFCRQFELSEMEVLHD